MGRAGHAHPAAGGSQPMLTRVRQVPPRLLVAEVVWRTARAGLRRAPASRPGRGAAPYQPVLRERATPAVLSPAVDACVEEAEAALVGRLRILGYGWVDFGH